jgi:hypothetical protein
MITGSNSLDQLRETIKHHIQNSKVVDDIKANIVQNKDLSIGDKNAIMQKLKTEGILSQILQQIPVKKL